MHTFGLMSAAVANPVAAALAVLGGEVMTRALSRPVTARSVANWARTYDLAISKPTAASAKAMRFASQRLGSSIARELDMPASAAEFSAGLYAGYANAGGRREAQQVNTGRREEGKPSSFCSGSEMMLDGRRQRTQDPGT